MAAKVIIIIVIAASIACVFTQSPVKIEERYLHVSGADNDQVVGKGWQDSVPGLPGKDYPNLTSIPETSFSCEGKTPGGYYADVETRCQVFHVCSTQSSKSSFLCPSGSIFNQRHFVCDWWYDFECYQAPKLYSLNDGLDDPEPSSVTSLQFNSLGGPSTDLSLASSGYSNNLRDGANLYYEAYTSPKTQHAGRVHSTEKAESTVSSHNGNSNVDAKSSVSTTSGISNSDATRFSTDNYSYTRQSESAYNRNGEGRLNGLELNQLQTTYHQGENNDRTRSYKEDGLSTTYRKRPADDRDIVPRGFSKSRSDEKMRVTYPELKRNDHSPGLLINSGLSNGVEKTQNNDAPRENNYVEYSNDNEANGKDYYINENNRFQDYYNNLDNNPNSQKNNNYVNRNNDNYNNYKINDTNNARNNEYSSKTDINNSYDQSNNKNNVYYENDYDGVENSEYNPNSNRNVDFPDEPYIQSFEESTAKSQSIYLYPTEEDADRERQREVDSVDLKRKLPQQHHRQVQGRSSSTFLIREEEPRAWRDDLSASSSDPNFSPNKIYSELNSPSLTKPEDTTAPIASDNVEESTHRSRQQLKYLGRRPAGGLSSGSGNGLPGANKILAASDSITGKPSTDSDYDQLSPAVTGASGTWNEDGLSNWGGSPTSHPPLKNGNNNKKHKNNNNNNNNNDDDDNNNGYLEFEGYGGYSSNGGPSWRDGSRFKR